jgi:hypothetical protein
MQYLRLLPPSPFAPHCFLRKFVRVVRVIDRLLQYVLNGVQFVEDAFLGIIPAIAVGDKDWPPSVPALQPEREVRVFVHYRAGISRSRSVVVAYGIP